MKQTIARGLGTDNIQAFGRYIHHERDRERERNRERERDKERDRERQREID